MGWSIDTKTKKKRVRVVVWSDLSPSFPPFLGILGRVPNKGPGRGGGEARGIVCRSGQTKHSKRELLFPFFIPFSSSHSLDHFASRPGWDMIPALRQGPEWPVYNQDFLSYIPFFMLSMMEEQRQRRGDANSWYIF